VHRRLSYARFATRLHDDGVRATVGAAAPFAAKVLRLWWWDKRHHVSTRHRVFKADLGVVGGSADHACPYEATDTTVLPRLLSLLSIRHADYTFVDLGAGKGQALFLAAEFPFKRIVGVELSPALSAIALQNSRTFRSKTQACTSIAVTCGDAADFVFPADPLVVYLFNPFDAIVLARVMSRLVESIDEHPRDVWLVYHHPRHRDVVEASGAFQRLFTGTDERDFRMLTYDVFHVLPMTRAAVKHALEP
jgi:SAM-dependent methyltransferase